MTNYRDEIEKILYKKAMEVSRLPMVKKNNTSVKELSDSMLACVSMQFYAISNIDIDSLISGGETVLDYSERLGFSKTLYALTVTMFGGETNVL